MNRLIFASLFGLILFGPIFFSLVRKSTLGQSSQLEAIGPVLVVVLWICIFRKRGIGKTILPLMLLSIFYFFYLMPSVGVHPISYFLFVFVLGILPIFLFSMSGGLLRIQELNLFVKISKYYLYAQVIIVISSFVLYNLLGYMPYLLSAVESHGENKIYRLGFVSYSAVYVNNVYFSYSILFSSFLLLFLSFEGVIRKRGFVLISSILIIGAFMSTRRAVFYLTFFVLVVFYVRYYSMANHSRFLITISLVFLGVFVFLLSGLEGLLGEGAVLLTGGDASIYSRIDSVFLKFVTFWINETPFGTFTGHGSGISKSFNIRDLSQPTEVGAALIVLETGIFGLFFQSSIMLIALINSVMRSVFIRKSFLVFPSFAFVFYCLFFFKENGAINFGTWPYILFYFSIVFPFLFDRKEFRNLPLTRNR